MLELLDTKKTWIGIGEDGTETEYRTLMVICNERRDTLYVIYTHDLEKDLEDMETCASKLVVHEDEITLEDIETADEQELVDAALNRLMNCHRMSRQGEQA